MTAAVGIELQAAHLVRLATDLGLDLTIEHEPLKPLAMGNYRSVITVRPRRGAGATVVRAMPPRAADLLPPASDDLEADRKAFALISAEPVLASMLYDLDLLPEQIARADDRRWALMHSVVTHFRIACKTA